MPKTEMGKVIRRFIRAAYLGEDQGDISSLENSSAVDQIRYVHFLHAKNQSMEVKHAGARSNRRKSS